MLKYRITLALGALFLLGMSSEAAGELIWNLAADWSDTNNPNGVWSYNHGTLPISTHHGDWPHFAFVQPAWSEQPFPAFGHIPAWFKATGTPGGPFDWQSGDVIVHGSDPFSGPRPNDPANVTWTSPIAGLVEISGRTWLGRDVGRSADWSIYLNGTLLTKGSLTSTDPYDSANPFDFSTGSGGPSALIQSIDIGDVIEFEVVRTHFFGEFVGVDMTIQQAGSVVPNLQRCV
jgi:hypothetical protein